MTLKKLQNKIPYEIIIFIMFIFFSTYMIADTNINMLEYKLQKSQYLLKVSTIACTSFETKRYMIPIIKSYIEEKYKNVLNIITEEIAIQIIEKSIEHKISPYLVIAIIEVESGFNPMAISSMKAKGLMQIMPEWCKKFNIDSKSDIFNIETNIDIGIKIFNIHLKEADGNIPLGLYYYVGKNNIYASKVYNAMGKFIIYETSFRKDITL